VDGYSLFFRLFYTGKKISLSSHQSMAVSLLDAFLNKWPKTTSLIFVFDCPVKSQIKMETIQKRREMEQAIQKEIKDIEEAVQTSPFNPLLLARKDALQRRSKETFPSVCKEMRSLLLSKGYEIIVAKDEAEYHACEMVINGKADFVYSNDSDCLALGCPAVIFDENGGFLKMYRHETILRSLNLKTKEEFRDFCILLGTDYNGRLFGPEEAYSTIQRYGGIQSIPVSSTHFEKITEGKLEDVQRQYTITTQEMLG
jgi:5'-3' exonuclease